MEATVVVEEANNASEGVRNNMKPAVVVDAGVEGNAAAAATESYKKKKNHIQVSNTKKPLLFYLNLAKRLIKQNNDIELSALGMAIPTVVIIAEILKRNGLAIEKRITTSSFGAMDGVKGRMIHKPQIEIVLEKADKTTVATA
ncbi:hypothetical protein I3843_01G182300 [Carya illinoinensis]|uniref:DNA/RNA-binding protein Alba-like domain-containing protein n=1 Tax=Carya illinoinensis TaxID=32201 RepID=A0A8T1RPM2_CARIL|nr:uncharacterized protein At2g34160-like [Carya illinoinensis]KAG6668706.1 hypothetical protein CIPAW_01G190100 [Carya illinoinensis]KAG7996844.1 hypothetical protein I3843_01G182300 [Carya illinoinensis]